MPSPAPREMKRLFSSEVKVRIGNPDASGFAPCEFSLDIPGLKVGLMAQASVGGEGLDQIRHEDGAVFALAGRALNRLIGEAMVARVAAMGEEVAYDPPDVAQLRADFQALREKYDRLVCSRLGILHD